MIQLPKTTEFNKRIPKQKFYEKMDVPHKLKRIFVEQIKIVYWRNKISSTTMNISEGKDVLEIEVFEIKLNSPILDESLLRQIDREIPYHILFLLEYQGKYQAWIGYKEAINTGTNAFKVDRYYHTEWLSEVDLPLRIEGLSTDQIYENFVRQIGGENLDKKTDGESIKESIERDKRKQSLEKQIEKLIAKMRKEKQLNKQMEINGEIKRLKKERDKI